MNLYIFLISFLLSWLLLYFGIPFLRKYFKDKPNSRSSHEKITPRSGGISFVLLGIVNSIFNISSLDYSIKATISLICIPLAIVSLIDDYKDLPILLRYAIQILTSMFMVLNTKLPLGKENLYFYFSILFLLILSTALINFMNFMDGIDSLVAGCMFIVLLFVGLKHHNELWSVTGALLAFLYWNWSPAKVFMGDIGSTFLGALLAFIVLQSSTWIDALAILILSTPLTFDALTCVLKRLLAKQNIFQAHKLHLYQRLHQSGWSHTKVSVIYMIGTLVLSITYLYDNIYLLVSLCISELLLGYWLDQNIAIPFNIGENVKVIDGPFNGFTGTIENVNEEKRKLEVMVKIFGRKTPLELSYMQVEKL